MGIKDNPEFRNMNPHAEAEIARILYSEQYDRQDGGLMDFWDMLTEKRKSYCVCVLNEILSLPRWADWKEP